MFGSSVGLEDEARQVFLQDGGLLSVRVVDGDLALLQAGQRPVTHRQLSGTHTGQDGLTGCHWFHLTPRSLQLLQELTARLCMRRERGEEGGREGRTSTERKTKELGDQRNKENWRSVVCVCVAGTGAVRAPLWTPAGVHGGQLPVQDEPEPAVGAVGELERSGVRPDVETVPPSDDGPVLPVVRLPLLDLPRILLHLLLLQTRTNDTGLRMYS